VPTGAEIIPVDDLVRVRVTNASKSMVSLALFPPKDPHDALLFVRDSFEDFSFVNERNRLVQQGAMEEKLCLAYYHGRTKLWSSEKIPMEAHMYYYNMALFWVNFAKKIVWLLSVSSARGAATMSGSSQTQYRSSTFIEEYSGVVGLYYYLEQAKKWTPPSLGRTVPFLARNLSYKRESYEEERRKLNRRSTSHVSSARRCAGNAQKNRGYWHAGFLFVAE
jgi:hypothetical protein